VCCSVLQSVLHHVAEKERDNAKRRCRKNMEENDGAVCCSVLQCVAVCGSVQQCAAVCCSVVQSVAVRCSALQYVVLRCSALQCVTERYSRKQRAMPAFNTFLFCQGPLREKHIRTRTRTRTHTHHTYADALLHENAITLRAQQFYIYTHTCDLDSALLHMCTLAHVT